jgi:O-antigen ligase
MLIPGLSTEKMIGLAGGLIVFILCFASTEIALYILIFSMFLSPEFIVGATAAGTLGRGVTLRLDDFLLLIIGFSWLARMSINKELGLFLRTPLNRPIAYYIIICLVSTLVGALFGRVDLKTGFFYVLKYFEYMIVYFMVVNHLTSKKQIRNFMWALFITAAIVSVIAIIQIPSGGRVTAPFEGSSGEPNTLGGYLVFMIAICGGMLLTASSIRDKMVFSCLILLFVIPMFYTQSRSSYLAVIPVLLTFVWLSEKRSLVMGVILLIMISLPFIAPEPAKERISYTFTQGVNRRDVVEVGGVKLDTSSSARLVSWRDAARDWIRHPFIGYGVTGYRFVDGQYIKVITETGFLGLITFFFLVVTLFRRIRTDFADSSSPFHKGFSIGFLAGFVGLLFHAIGANTFIIVRIMEPFWFMTAMAIMLPQLEEKEFENS